MWFVDAVLTNNAEIELINRLSLTKRPQYNADNVIYLVVLNYRVKPNHHVNVRTVYMSHTSV